MLEKILIVDFGSQVTQLIARRIRESNVYCEIHPYNKITCEFIKKYAPIGIILSGSPGSVLDENSPTIPVETMFLNIPILGICYGQQLMAHLLGGKVKAGDTREFGRAFIDITTDCSLFENIHLSYIQVWMSHGDQISELPNNWVSVAYSPGAPNAATMDVSAKHYGVQFHPEVMHTVNGTLMLKNFTYDVCGCSGNWTMHNFKEKAISDIQNTVGSNTVICGLSGGVDSSVTATLLHEAIGDQLQCILVDNGLMRENEVADIVNIFNNLDVPLICRDASAIFLNALNGVSDPEQKRKIIGTKFIEIFEEEAQKIGGAKFLAQGTLYPDVIESVSVHGSPSSTIKSHHNVGGLPDIMNLELVEPLRELFKDEVRELGKELGLPTTLIGRHPFPGPGLAVRILGEVTKEKCDLLRKADTIFINELKNEEIYDEIWQAFPVLLPIRTVGVMGDSRTYDQVIALRAITSIDGMTADVYLFEPEFLLNVSSRIVNEVNGISRVVYDYTSKPPGTIEWE